MISFFRRKKKEQEQKPEIYKVVVNGKKMYIKNKAKIQKYKMLERAGTGCSIFISKVK